MQRNLHRVWKRFSLPRQPKGQNIQKCNLEGAPLQGPGNPGDKGTIYSGAFGVRSLGQSQAMTLDSVFWIASMTKAVTTAAAMQMVEQGKLKLDQPASEILPDLASQK